MHARLFVSLAAVAFAIGNGTVLGDPPPRPPSFRGLGTLCGTEFLSAGAGVSDDGRIVVGQSAGDLRSEPTTFYPSHAIRSQHGLMVDLGDLPGGIEHSAAISISDDGSVIVGESSSAASDPDGAGVNDWVEAFRWTEAGGLQPLGDLPGGAYLSFALAVSADGSVIGGGSDSANGYEAFLHQSGVMIPLGDLPGGAFYSYASRLSDDGSVAAGIGSSAVGFEAMRWTAAGGMVGLGLLSGAPTDGHGSVAVGMSDDGSVIVGGSASPNSGPLAQEAFVWTEQSGMVGLGDLPGGPFDSQAQSVSGDGSIIIGIALSDSEASRVFPGWEAFIWDETHAMRTIQSVLTSELGLGADLESWTLLAALDISSDGRTIVGFGVNPIGELEGWIAYLGEPVGQKTCAGDTNGDGLVNVQDLVAVITAWGICP